jgi:hypothetical protein
MPSRARAPARTVSGSHFPPKGSVYVEAPGVRSRGPPRAPQKSVKKAATAVKNADQEARISCKQGQGQEPPRH